MKRLYPWLLLVSIVVVDFITKLVAADRLTPYSLPHRVVGDYFRFTLVYNRGAAFGLYLGDFSRWIFMALTLGALVILWRLYRQTAETQTIRLTALSMVAAGAIGNLIDRIRSENGVVDFLDVGIGIHRWPTFNVADMAVSCGAVLLAIVLWREEAQAASAARAARATTLSTSDAIERS